MSLAFLLAAGAAGAGDPRILASVESSLPEVTLSRPDATPPLPTYAGYEVRIVNASRHTVNHVRFVASTKVVGAAGKAPFVEAVGANCVPTNAERTAIACALGTLRGKGGSAVFTLVFGAPAAGTAIRLDWAGAHGEGEKDSGHAAHLDGFRGRTVTPLVPPDPDVVRTFLPSGGGTVYTGKNGIPTEQDPSTTAVRLPTNAPATSAELEEAVDANSCSYDLSVCFFSRVTVPGRFDDLRVKLRRDDSTIRKRAKIENAKIFYAPDDIHFFEIHPCSITPAIPGRPCIDSRLCVRGGWLFVIRAKDNGRYRW